MRTVEFSAVFGVVPGFNHDNDVGTEPLALVAAAWDAAAEAERAAHGLYVGAALTERRVLYPRDQGCPEGGEISVEAMGTCNLRCEDPDAWRDGVRRVVEATRSKLGQATVRIVFRDVEDELLTGPAMETP
jgi:hypothetical protein